MAESEARKLIHKGHDMPSFCNRSILITSIAIALSVSTLPADDSVWQTGYGANANWKIQLDIPEQAAPQLLWTQMVGEGRSQVVCDDKHVYVVSGGAPKPKVDPTILTTTVTALTAKGGGKVWSFENESKRYPSQETFSGAKPCPRATPLLHNERLFVVTFSGQLICLSAREGRQLWMIDLVEQSEALPVQFGFSASVTVDPDFPDRVFVVAAGPEAGFYCLDARNGAEVWKAECSTSSYGTPVMATFGRQRQWLLVTEDEVLGVAADSGKLLWAYELLEPGLTNVPTPLVIDDRSLLISGQGCNGTVAIQVTNSGDVWNVKQQWSTRRLQFFYTNWIKLNDQVVIGCTDKYLAAVDIDSGEVLGRWRGFADGHVLSCQDNQLLVLGGKGKLSVLTTTANDPDSPLVVERQYQLVNRRCWTPLSVAGRQWFLRHDDQLCCYSFRQADYADVLEQLVGAKRKLTFSTKPGDKPGDKSQQMKTISPVELIFATFESKGPEAAVQLYDSLRSDGKLDEGSRIALIEAARQNGQNRIAALVLQQALADFPKSGEVRALIIK